MPSLTLITFPSLVNLIFLISVVLGILTSLFYCSTDMPCQYCIPVLSIQFRYALYFLIDCATGTGGALIVSLSPPSSWLIYSSTTDQSSHLVTKSPPSIFDLLLPSSLMPLFTSILLPITAWCFFTSCLVSILLTSISTSYGGIKKEQWYNKFVRGVQGQNPSSLENLVL